MLFRSLEGIQPPSKHLVLLVHGILRSTGTFSALEKALIEAGFDAVAISYPSTRSTIEDHAEELARLLDRQEGSETVSFATHSMGGLSLRHLPSRAGVWPRRIPVRRIVLRAPPNHGSATPHHHRQRLRRRRRNVSGHHSGHGSTSLEQR